MNIKKFVKDVRGAALVYVIVAAAIIILLGAATTVTAFVNLRATQIQEQSDNNFYNADSVMNAIVSGLEADVSTAYEAAYTQVITKIDTYDSSDAAKQDFKRIYVEELNALLGEEGEMFKNFYSTSRIQSYVQNVFEDDVRYSITALNGNCYLDISDDGLVLRNLHVTYEDDSGYFDEITTDIKLGIPDFAPPPSPLTDGISSLVVEDGLELLPGTGLIINGSIHINERESDRSAILLQDNSSLLTMSDEFVAGGLIKTQMNTTITLLGSDPEKTINKIWTENFDLGRSTVADIRGEIYVMDDLEVNGSYCNVKMAGQYYGYSKANGDMETETGDARADNSSAININGAHTVLNIEALDTLVLAGSSYVSSTSHSSGLLPENGFDILLGEALSVKSNQIAYLVDDSEFKDGQIIIQSNPMSYQQYKDMCDLNNDGELGDSEQQKAMNLIGRKILSYGKSYNDYGASIKPIFSNMDNGTVYLYLHFSDTDAYSTGDTAANDAAKYFIDAYTGDTLLAQRLRTYAAQYVEQLVLDPDTKLLVNQNYINVAIALYNNEIITKDGFDYDMNSPEQTQMNQLISLCRELYLGDGTAANPGEKYEVLYKNIINPQKLTEFVRNATAASSHADNITNNKIKKVTNGVVLTGTDGAQAVIIDNAGKDAYVLGSGSGLVIASGDVKMTGDWLGTIIVGGRLYVDGGTKEAPLALTIDYGVASSASTMYYSFESGDTTLQMSVVNLFKGHEDERIGVASTESTDKDMVSNLITFNNWNRD